MIDLKILGERLRQLRKQDGLTQSELATAVRTSQTAISRLENGDEIYASVLISIFHYYQERYSLDYLFTDNFDTDHPRLKHRSIEEIRQQLEDLIHLL